MIRFTTYHLLLLLASVHAHFPLVDNAHGGDIFDTWDTAANITDITRSSSTSRVALCGHLYFWLKFTRPADFNPLMVGGTVPVIERFKDNRVAVAVFGRGLPGPGASQEDINQYCNRSPVGRLCKGYDDLPADLQAAHGEIQTSMGVSDLGVIAVPGVEDQSNCDFGEDPLTLGVTGRLYRVSEGGDDVKFATYHDWEGESHCFFHEEFGGSDMWMVQDKLIDLAGDGEHFIVFWTPGDQSLGEATEPAKFGSVFGDMGQSEDFSGEILDAGECSLPSEDFYEQDCHGYTTPVIPSLLEGALRIFFGDRFAFFSMFLYLPFGGAPCKPSYAVSVPNVYTCGADEPPKACTSLCHNHGFCPANLDGAGIFNTTECTTDIDENGFPMCAETCAREVCGADQETTKYGPVGPGCATQTCKTECTLLIFGCKEICEEPSPECSGTYEHD